MLHCLQNFCASWVRSYLSVDRLTTSLESSRSTVLFGPSVTPLGAVGTIASLEKGCRLSTTEQSIYCSFNCRASRLTASKGKGGYPSVRVVGNHVHNNVEI
ncbi:hypothetical protein Adt_05363 [Abeliophyllum distichum]|uniref:Secreted protein n=1 Tax=Abeliophyllum distichum TaxID=126358 RepID=A0ABD1V459_9LAMI